MKKKIQKKRPGRPKTKNPATNTLGRVRVTDEQIHDYQTAADRAGKTFSAWVREVLDKAV